MTELIRTSQLHSGNHLRPQTMVISYSQLNFTCADTVTQLSAHNSGITTTPTRVTHCPPHSIDADLHSAFIRRPSINQSKGPIATTQSSCWKKAYFNWNFYVQRIWVHGQWLEAHILCKLWVGNSFFIGNTTTFIRTVNHFELHLCSWALTVECVASAHGLENVVKEGGGSWASLIAGLEYWMGRWNGKWNGISECRQL